ncbi:hypothetical protein LDL77_11325 [Flagellimonas marinaquae]|nr:hypothetical protein LDL77_11325 [Allomuricauda aquimarina]
MLKMKSLAKPEGLHWLTIKENQIEFSMNARILKENYAQGICLDTLDQLHRILKETGIELDPYFPEATILKKVHIKNDNELEFSGLMHELSITGNANKYNKVIRENSITYECTNKTEKTSLRIYGKEQEIKRNRSKYMKTGITPGQFKGITRTESHFNNPYAIGKHLKTKNLLEVLKMENVNYKLLQTILKGQPTIIEQPELQQMNLTELKNFALTFLLNEMHNGNLNAIRNEIKSRLGSSTKPTYSMKKIKKYLPMVKNIEGKELKSVIKLIECLKESDQSPLKI